MAHPHLGRWLARAAGATLFLPISTPAAPLPEPLAKALAEQRPDGERAGAIHASGEIPEAFRLATVAAFEIRGDDDLQSRAALDLVDALLDSGHDAAAVSVAEKTPGHRSALGLAKCAFGAGLSGREEDFRDLVGRAELKLEPYRRTRRGQEVMAYLAAAYMAAGERQKAVEILGGIDLAGERALAEALCWRALSLRGEDVPFDERGEESADLLRPNYLAKAEAMLEAVEREVAAGDVQGITEEQQSLIESALRFAERSRLNLAAIKGRASAIYRSLGEVARAEGLESEAIALVPRSAATGPQRVAALGVLADVQRQRGDLEAMRANLDELRQAITTLPITLRAKACADAATLAMRAGMDTEAEALLIEELERSMANPNPRVGALARCYSALSYARTGRGLPDELARWFH